MGGHPLTSSLAVFELLKKQAGDPAARCRVFCGDIEDHLGRGDEPAAVADGETGNTGCNAVGCGWKHGQGTADEVVGLQRLCKLVVGVDHGKELIGAWCGWNPGHC